MPVVSPSVRVSQQDRRNAPRRADRVEWTGGLALRPTLPPARGDEPMGDRQAVGDDSILVRLGGMTVRPAAGHGMPTPGRGRSRHVRDMGRSGQERWAPKAAAAASGVAAAYVWAGGGVAVRPRRPLGTPPAPAQTCVRFGWRPHPWGRLVDRRPCPTLFTPVRPCVTAFLLCASLRPAPGSVNLGPSLANRPSVMPDPWAVTAPVLSSAPYP